MSPSVNTLVMVLFFCYSSLVLSRGSYPIDRGVVGEVLVPLSGPTGQGVWSLTSSANSSAKLQAVVPGDLVTDLELSGVIGDPLYELNFRDPVWDHGNYTYTLTFPAPPQLRSSASAWLVFEGVKMVADLTLNGQYRGFFNDQFLRYTFPVAPSSLKADGNVVEVTFPPFNDTRSLTQRLMGCSGGWDWAFFSGTFINKTIQTFSKAIWRPVYMVGIAQASVAITHVSPRTFYKGAYPSTPLEDDSHGDFEVQVAVNFEAGAGGASGTLAVSGGWEGGAALPRHVSLPPGNSSVMVVLAAANNSVKLWWPAQTPGNQTRYPVTVTFTPEGAGTPVIDSRMIGFRVFTLVTGNDTDPSTLAGRDGQDHFTMRFKVNGADIWSRGSNMIPMEEMEGRTTAEGLRRLVQSAVEGGFNTFRLWGGGIFQYDAWYDACDEYGVLIYHDMMYTQGHFPTASTMQSDEITYQVRRLAHHPSIAIWDACNECGGGGIYADFVMTTVVREDTSRPPWPSCPANGWTSGVDALWGLPNGSPLGLQPRLVEGGKEEGEEVAAQAEGEGWLQFALRGGCSSQPEAVATALGCGSSTSGSGASSNCTFVPNQDYAGGAGGPHAPAESPADCCSLCAANPDCEVGVFQNYGCFFKTKADAQGPQYKEGVVAAWPGGRTPPPPGPPFPGCAKQYSYETHGFYLHGDGYKTVNSKDGRLGEYDVNMPPAMLQEAVTGPSCPGTFSSEFGAVAISSWESLSPTLAPSDWGLHNAAMAQRNYAIDNIVVATDNTPWPSGFDNVTGELPLKKNLYFGMLGQALFVKSAIEGRKSANSFGALIWQFNEVWPTGGWGSIEYGTVGFTPGQVEGGRWKPLQYFLRRFLYRDHHIAASIDARVMMRSDDPFALTKGTASLTYLHLPSGSLVAGPTFPVALPKGAAATAWSCADGMGSSWQCTPWGELLPKVGCAHDGSDCVLLLKVTDSGTGGVLAENFELLAPVWKLALPPSTVTAAVGVPLGDGSVPITLTASATALFVHLTTLAQGRFSDNSLLLPPGVSVISFLPWGPLDLGLLKSSLRVEHVQLYGVNATQLAL